MNGRVKYRQRAEEVIIPVSSKVSIHGSLTAVNEAIGFVLFIHGSGSGRFSPRNCFVADELNRAGISTLMIDLLTKEEERADLETGDLRFDIELLTSRVKAATNWIIESSLEGSENIGYFGSSTGAAAALSAAGEAGDAVKAVVSRGGRCDLAEPELMMVKAPVLFIVGENDTFIVSVTQNAMEQMLCEKKLIIIEGANHLFEEPGALEEVAEMTARWLVEVMSNSN